LRLFGFRKSREQLTRRRLNGQYDTVFGLSLRYRYQALFRIDSRLIPVAYGDRLNAPFTLRVVLLNHPFKMVLPALNPLTLPNNAQQEKAV
jgi:hypothetical protein